jgi:hypothetical protein
MTTLADNLVPDELWALVEPLLPVPPRPPYGGRHRTISDRACLAAIVYMARTSTPLAAAARPGARLRLAGDLLAPPHRVGQRRCLRPAPPRGARPAGRAGPAGLGPGGRGHHERAGPAWGDQVGANPVDRGKPGSKLHLVCDGSGVPLTAVVTAANVNDTAMFQAVVADLPPIRTPAGGGAPDQPPFMRTRAMTAAPTGPTCAGAGSRRGSLGGRSSRQPGLGATAGRLNGHCRG